MTSNHENPLVNKHSGLIGRLQKLFIHGQWQDGSSGESIPVYDPSNGRQISQLVSANAADVGQAVESAKKCFHSAEWAKMKPTERQRLLLRLADLIAEHADELAELESIDNGKPVMAARQADLNNAIEFVRYMAGWATKISGQTLDVSVPRLKDGEFFAYTKPQPVGVVAAIVPWNFPLVMALWKVAPALATGCTVVLKPAEQSSLTALRLAELVVQAGYPDGVLNVITGFGHIAGDALINHRDIDKISFTGSVPTGKVIGRAAVEGMKRFTLELGGKSPMIIMPDISVEQAVQGAAMGIFYNQGQVCTAASRLYVHRSKYAEVVEGIATMAAQMPIGPGFEPSTQIGPLISESHANKVAGYVDIGQQEGAELLTGGQRLDCPGYYVSPAVLANTNNQMRVVKEEIFGPVLSVMPFDSTDEVIALANDSEFGLAASVWTKDLTTAHRVTESVQAGISWVNCHNVLDPNLPFGGVGFSGIGRELGAASIEAYFEPRSVMMRLA